MRDSPPEGFEGFVVARGPALHRTAELLTRNEQAAADMVQVALAKAWRAWSRIDGNPEAYVRRIIINEFTSASSRRWRGQQSTAELPALHGDGDRDRDRDRDCDDAESVSLTDPSQALCLKLAGTPRADEPLAGMCDSARCPQATHHLGHRNVWAKHAETTKTFLGSLGPNRRIEKIRLKADYQRARQVLDEIDTSAHHHPKD
jgi:hypothetical protein